MNLGFYVPNSGDGATGRDVGEIARRAEEMGFHSLWVADHIVAPVEVNSHYPFHPQGEYHNRPDTPYLEPLTTLAFVAGATQRARLVVSVLILPYRHPLATAKIAASVDVLSGGRLVVGVGVGWMEEEFRALGHDYFPRRGRNTNEQLEILRRSWSGEAFAFDGEFYTFQDLMVVPAPVQDPLPVWVGGHTDASLRRTVRYGQATNGNAEAPEEVARVKARLNELADEAGQPVPDITLRSHLLVADEVVPFRAGHIIGPASYITERLEEYAELGVTEFGIDNRVDGIDVMRRNLEALTPVLERFTA